MDQKNLSSHRSCCISHEFYKSASKNPNKIAVIHSSRRHSTKSTTEIDHFIETSPSHDHHPVYKDDVCFTYSEILEAVDSLSRRLRFILDGGADPYLIRPSTGSTPIDQSTNTPRIVGIYMAPSVEYIISILSILRCGEAFMPLDPSWPKERVLSVVSSSTSKLILCGSTSFDENYSHQINKYRFLVDNVSCPVLVISMKTNLNNYFSSHSLLYPCENKTLRSFCYLMYTSGSTGKPKGVCGTEQGLLNRFVWMQDMCPLCGEETLLFKTSIGFIDHLQEILGALLTTCTLVIPPFSVLKENILSITEYLQDYSINRLVAIPSLMRMLLPSLQSSYSTTIQTSLKLLILSGEILHLSLWSSLIKLLPNTTILNLYGSTEVSGDCTYFDCRKLPSLLETESLTTVPIGMPLPNCNVSLLGEEIYVSGLCNAIGYINHEILPLDVANFHLGSAFFSSIDEKESVVVFKTGDFAKQLPSGDLVFVGRNDRIVKVNGNRIALEEIEDTLRLHNDVDDAVVIFKRVGEVAYIEAYVVVKHGRSLSCCIRGWMFEKLPLAMIPRRFLFVDSIPISSSSGKVDYGLLESLRCSVSDICSEMDEILDSNRLQTIKEAFCDALLVEKVNNNDDFFDLGGDSISAAHASHKLGINMKLLYSFPSPLNLLMALMDPNNHPLPIVSNDTHLKTKKLHTRLSNELDESSSNNHPPHKVLKMDYDHWDSISNHMCFCAITRCNKVMFGEKYDNINTLFQANLVREEGVFLYIGSHSRKFICVKASSGVIQWEVELEGRVECSATILGDFSQVVVGCYKGNIYFLNSMNGSITWTFHTGGEVKSQPVLDKQRHLVWCGSYDHNLYALDYQTHSCVYNLNCGGSIYGSPVINEVDETLYFASTNGSMTALSLKAIPFNVLWVQDMGAPIFGSLSINHNNRNVICCLVNGHVVAVDANGSIIWREKGNLLWKHDLGDPIVSSAYVDENLGLKSDYSHVKEDRLICVCTSSGSIVVLRIKLDCNEVEDFGRLDIDGDIFSSPVFICGKIFVGCRDDYVYCLEIEG
ncbi:unnamed protein product [Lactuca virosa]|uniref:4-coumarate--CoA ligase n=1 Tax=Lactuca virosa TaxID=75947 RepID=A0AAU9NSW8_9ASTR|nr:unnamed protein product [Lactuca virosa]